MSAVAVTSNAPQAVQPQRRARTLPAQPNPYVRERKTLGDPTPLACTVAKAALEIVHGAPGVNTLTRWVAPTVRESLASQQSLARRAGWTGPQHAKVERVRVCRISPTAAEVSVVADHNGHSHAIAMRLEDTSGKWLTTVLEVG